MKPEKHIEIIKESLEVIRDSMRKSLVLRQSTIGFHTTLAATEMLELYLHKKNLFSLSARLNHRWLKSIKKVDEKLSFSFPRKNEIINLIYRIEKNRDELCYGKRVDEAFIKEQIEMFYKLKRIFEEEGLDEIK